MEFPEALLGVDSAFDCAMVLFHDIVQIANGPTAAAQTKFPCSLQLVNCSRIGRIPVYIDDTRPGVARAVRGSL